MWLCSESLEVSVDPCWGVRFNYASGKERHLTWWGISGWGHVGEASAVAVGSGPGALTLV